MDPLVFAFWSSIIVVGGGGFLFWATGPEEDGVTPLSRWLQALRALRGGAEKPHHDENRVQPARTGAEPVRGGAPHWDAGADEVRGEVRGAEPAVSAGSLVLSPAELVAVQKMVLHKLNAASPTKASTILAGFNLRKSGESKPYARASEIYEAIFNPPEAVQYPALDAQRRGEVAAPAK